MSNLTDQMKKALMAQAPGAMQKHIEEIIRKNKKPGEKVEVKLVNGQLPYQEMKMLLSE